MVFSRSIFAAYVLICSSAILILYASPLRPVITIVALGGGTLIVLACVVMLRLVRRRKYPSDRP